METPMLVDEVLQSPRNYEGNRDSAQVAENPMHIVGVHPGVATRGSHPDKMRSMKRKGPIQEGNLFKRVRSNYDWRGNDFVYGLLAKNAKLADKFKHLSSSRPPD